MGRGNYNNLLEKIANILIEARTKAVREINKAQVLAYWEIGREIVDFEQKGKARAEYGEELLKKLSTDMNVRFGKGFSRSNLQNMRLFYLAYPKCQTLSGKFSGGQKFQTSSEKSETVSRKSSIQQTLSAEWQKKPDSVWQIRTDALLVTLLRIIEGGRTPCPILL